MRILIADDDPQFLRALRITLGARGYEVLLARDGQHALEMAIDHKPDIILLDLGTVSYTHLTLPTICSV